MKILFMCVANSARSQMAEGLAKSIFGSKAWIESAGSQPKTVNPYGVRAMNDLGLDISEHYSKSYADLPEAFTKDLNYIITLCAEEVCPYMPTQTAKRLHWPFQDPAGHSDSDSEQLARFAQARDLIKKRLEQFADEILK